ncbi:hypothetical protein, unlikely [Trypanosoma brucei brucei TREU927]|uniref:Uncharacterized protein n=1 Tax=Trypanosoma brucei brucei (strain 927/4 GUTat10.1) TaxID=185431 RepID=Q38DY3_TRYB2|nr:hypothetical protein, unlikely [Trypanosoma brucei brucei TREU927]EAN76987.1 hypothetical protein, unlikely [Trypanosoma brucei brucei TREU927]
MPLKNQQGKKINNRGTPQYFKIYSHNFPSFFPFPFLFFLNSLTLLVSVRQFFFSLFFPFNSFFFYFSSSLFSFFISNMPHLSNGYDYHCDSLLFTIPSS